MTGIIDNTSKYVVLVIHYTPTCKMSSRTFYNSIKKYKN